MRGTRALVSGVRTVTAEAECLRHRYEAGPKSGFFGFCEALVDRGCNPSGV